MFKLDSEKEKGTQDHIANICWLLEITRDFQKKDHSILYFINYSKAFDCEDHEKSWTVVTETDVPKLLIKGEGD